MRSHTRIRPWLRDARGSADARPADRCNVSATGAKRAEPQVCGPGCSDRGLAVTARALARVQPPQAVPIVQAPYSSEPPQPSPSELAHVELIEATRALEAADVRGALKHASKASAIQMHQRNAGDTLEAAQLEHDRLFGADAEAATRALLDYTSAIQTVREQISAFRRTWDERADLDWTTDYIARHDAMAREVLTVAAFNASRTGKPADKAPDTTQTDLTAKQRFRRELYRMQDFWRRHTAHQRVHVCGREIIGRSLNDPDYGRAGPDIVQRPEGHLAYSGLIRCRQRSCAPCAVSRRAKVAREIQRSGELWALIYKTRPYMLTLTVRHGWSDDLEITGRGIRNCWRKFLQGRAWQQYRKKWGLEYVVAREVTHGVNGWHPHLHALIYTTIALHKTAELQLARALSERWEAVVRRELGDAFAPLKVAGEYVALDFRECREADYIAKLGLELADPGTKRKGRTPLELLRDAAAGANDPDPHKRAQAQHARELYAEHERVLHGTRDFTWSSGLRWMRWQLTQRIESEDRDYKARTSYVASLAGEDWREVLATPGARASLLEAGERGALWLYLGDLIGCEPWSVQLTETNRGPP